MIDVLRAAMPPWRRFAPALALGVLAAASAVALLATSAWLITRAAEQPPILYLTFAIVGVRAFALGRAFFRYLERVASHDGAFRQLGALRVAIYERMLPLGPDGVASARRGDLLARLVADVDRLQDLPLRVVQPIATALVVGIASVVAIATLSGTAALLLVACLVGAVVTGSVAQRWLAAASDRAVAPARARLDELVLAHVGRLDVLSAFDADAASAAAIADADAVVRAAQVRRARAAGAVAGISVLASGLATLLVLAAASPTALGGPVFALLVLVPIAVVDVVMVVPTAVGAWREVAVSAARVADAVPGEAPAGVAIAARRPLPSPSSSAVRLRGVGARWPGASSDALSAVSLDLAPGDAVLVTGPSGSGKTTLAHVLVRFLEYSGSFTIGGVEARDLDPDDVRGIIGLCEQSPHVFDDTVRQNLLFARETATDEELIRSLRAVGLGWELDEPVGERGALVSGGQAQRLALARALLAEFPVLVLDEPTANVDRDRADALVSDLLGSAAASGRAVLLISHVPVPSPLITRTLRLA